MKTQQNIPLADFTSFKTGGPAETLITIEHTPELTVALQDCKQPIWFLGDGANVLISDEGLPGTTLRLTTNNIDVKDDLFIADAGVEWDVLVQKSIEAELWGLERTSGIPGSVGAAVVGNIAAYGQAISETLQWVEVLDTAKGNEQTICLTGDELGFSYRYSRFQTPEFKSYVITRAAFKLSKQSKPLEYNGALKAAEDLKLDPNNLQQRRKIIMEARRRAGSLLSNSSKTAGSFFRNPEVSETQAEMIAAFEEREITADEVKSQNKVHGGSTTRVSAALVMLAAGFTRGQAWGNVRLHPDHVLKIENTGNASSQEIYDVAQEIIETTREKLGIELIPEVRFLGGFQ